MSPIIKEPFDAYKERQAINFSTLKVMAKSPKHYRHAVDHGGVDSPAFALGRACHLAVLEPLEWTRKVLVLPKTFTREKTTKKRGTELVEMKMSRDARVPEYCALRDQAADEGKELISQAEYEKATMVSRAVLLDPVASDLLRRPGIQMEQSITWERYGLELKSRLDIIAPTVAVVDLKTAADITPREWDRAAIRHQYLPQFAFYSDAYAQASGETVPFKAIVVEKTEPFDVAVVEFSEDDLEYGRNLYEGWLRRVIECTEAGEWPGMTNGQPRQFERPPWTYEDEDDEITLGNNAA